MSIAKDIMSKSDEDKKAILGSAFVASRSAPEHIASRTRSRSLSTDDGNGDGSEPGSSGVRKRKRS